MENLTKELLTEILGKEVVSFSPRGEDAIQIVWVGGTFIEMDVCRLAHLCKEWAWNQGFMLHSGVRRKERIYCEVYPTGQLNILNMDCFSTSEHEAIFKATQWIYDNKEQS